MKLFYVVLTIALVGVLTYMFFEIGRNPIKELAEQQKPLNSDSVSQHKDNDETKVNSSEKPNEDEELVQSMDVSLKNDKALLENEKIRIVANDKFENEVYIIAPAELKLNDFVFEEGVVVDEGFIKTYPMATNKFLKVVYPDHWNPRQKNISIKFQSNFDLLYGYSNEDKAFKILPHSLDKVTGDIKFRIQSRQREIIFGITEK